MAPLVYVREFHITWITAFLPSIYWNIPPENSHVSNSNLAKFCVNYDNSTENTVISFELNDPTGLESYQMDVVTNELFASSKLVARVNQPVCFLKMNSWYSKIKVTVTVNIVPIVIPVRNNTMEMLLDYCKRNEDQYMTFECRDTEVRALTVVMCSQSDVIETMLKSNVLEGKPKTVNAENFSAEVIKKMVEFCETANILDTKGLALQLCNCAHFFNVKRLKVFTAKLLKLTLDSANVVKLYCTAKIYTNKTLEEYCISLAHKNFEAVFKVTDYKHVDPEHLKEFITAVRERGQING